MYAYPLTLLIAFTATLLIATLSCQFLEKPLLKLTDVFPGRCTWLLRHTLRLAAV